MKTYFLLGLFASATVFSACTKKYSCDCNSNVGSIIFYKPGTETSMKDTCEKAGCTFTSRD
jgi:hypothetical protein